MPKLTRRFSSLLILAAGVAVAHADETISNAYVNTSVDGRNGSTSTFAWGEIFTVPTDGNDVLEDFTLDYANFSAVPMPVTSYLYAWTGSAISGAPLYTGTLDVPLSGFYAGTSSDIDVTLTPGAQYFFVSEVTGNNNLGIYLKTSGGTSSESAGFVGSSNGSPYYGSFAPLNLDFSATFGAAAPAPAPAVSRVPDSSSLWCEGLVLAALCGLARRKFSAFAA